MPAGRLLIPAFAAMFSVSAAAAPLKFNNVCPDPAIEQCKQVGKNAHNNFMNPPVLRGIKLGKIVGVSWKKEGAVIGIAEAVPSAPIPEQVRLSPRDAFYFIIDDGGGKPFLRQCVEIEAR